MDRFDLLQTKEGKKVYPIKRDKITGWFLCSDGRWHNPYTMTYLGNVRSTRGWDRIVRWVKGICAR